MEQLIRQLQASGRFRPEDDETDVVFFFPRPVSAFRGHGLNNTISQDFPLGNLVTAYRRRRWTTDPSGIFGSIKEAMANFKSAVLVHIREAANLVNRKATPDEANAYKQMIMNVAGKSARSFHIVTPSPTLAKSRK